jgi:membrane-bound lytic murein transglycosylase D
MVLKLMISFMLATFSLNSSYATDFPPSDTTTEKKDTLINVSPADPKDGFKNLYVPVAQTGAVSMAQLNPMAITFVEDYIDKQGNRMEELKITGKPYFDKMDDILVRNGLPTQLKYLAVIESFLQFNARSWAGAVGPWQFMPATARNMGLKVSRKVDERKDLLKSTQAACKYLATLFGLYGDWLLVVAAYNGGPGTVNSAIKKSGSRDFWELQRYLPLESRNHVKKFIATHYIMEGVGGITTLTKAEAENALLTDKPAIDNSLLVNSKTQSISGRYLSSVIAKHVTMEVAEFHKYNPGFDKQIASNGKYDLRLPKDKMDVFLAKKFDILGESVEILLNPDAVSKAN